jgi:hypothetical protein
MSPSRKEQASPGLSPNKARRGGGGLTLKLEQNTEVQQSMTGVNSPTRRKKPQNRRSTIVMDDKILESMSPNKIAFELLKRKEEFI